MGSVRAARAVSRSGEPPARGLRPREKLASHFVKAAWKKGGLAGWVERPGIIRPSDTVKVMLPTPVTYSLPPAAKGAG